MPDIWMDVDAALSEVPVNKVALIDDTDFKTREESVTYDQSGMDLVWNFVTTAGAMTQTAVTPTTGGVHDWTNQGNGLYSLEIPASAGTINNDTEGFGWFTGFATGILPWTGPAVGFRAAGLNNLLIDSAHSATRGLSGTALPDAVSDAAGGLPVSDVGGLDIDTLLGTLTSLAAETKDANVLDQFKTTRAVVEHMRISHTGQPIGDVYYVDPVNGDTHANGNRGGVTDPYLTIQDCHDNAVTDSNHDTIMLLAGAAAGVTTHTVAATTTISKRYTFIRGPGRDMIVTRSGAGDTLAVTADGVELSGFQIGTAATGSGNGIQVTDADFTRVENVWILDTQGDGINILRGENCQISQNGFSGTGQGGSGQGVHVVGTAGSSNRNHIQRNVFHACAGDGVLIEQGTTNQTLIHENLFEGCSGYGVNIGASSTDAFLSLNSYGGNTSGDVNDGGTDTIRTRDEEPAKHSIATEARLVELDAANLPADVDQIKADLPNRVTKNAALAGFTFLMVNGTDHVTPETGLTVSGTRSIDGAAFGALANAISEVANGVYTVDLAAADLNGNVITIRFTASGADDRYITIVTQPT